MKSRFALNALFGFAMAGVGFGSLAEHASHLVTLGWVWLKQTGMSALCVGKDGRFNQTGLDL
ncbi:MAG TPA: hypothetical protein VN281_09655 [Verrucomicrobiae bacterium]|jgi:hypothetical protein|nr:hypothetical protein [Verrucomicrobiae bacterium]